MALKGVKTYADESPLLRSSFRTSWTQPEGKVAAHIIEAVVTDVNVSTWTVDTLSKYDQLSFMDIQVSSPYLHPARGDGIYVMPEVGAKCHVCIPSDGPPPFLLDFIMPLEGNDVEAPAEGETNTPNFPGPYTYSGGRSRVKPGDIVMKGRDGNFVVLHRGGVLQIGSTSLAQRLYIPLQNLVEDISQNYRHYNTGGAVRWGVQYTGPDDELPTSHTQTFRLFADQDAATIRVRHGTFDQLAEPADGWEEDLQGLGIGNNPVICEVAVSPEGFNAEDGAPVEGAIDGTKLRFLFDQDGGVYLGSHSHVLLGVKGKLKVVVDDDIYIESKKSITLKAGTTLRIEGGDSMDISAGVTKINGGSKPVATVGSVTQFTVTAPVPIVIGVGPSAVPGVISSGAIISGLVTTGNPTVQV